MAQLLNRNKAKEVKQEELLVFGYSCKLFRDDDKASSIDNGDHLIPSMADQSLFIDRFDVRGTLYDLQAAESTGDGSELTEAEIKEEEVCNEERYLALYHDIESMIEKEEEQKKRLYVELEHGSSSFKQVGFSYNSVTAGQNNTEETQPQHAEPQQSYMPMQDEDAFIPPPTLPIPPGVVVPTSIKQHKVIVKTARFIATQDTQMEIVLKTKQANNILFGFLSFDDVLYQYYRHIVTLIKSGRFHEDVEPKVTEKVPEASFNPPQSAPGSLAQTPTSVKIAPPPDCSYTKLISKIRENQAKSGLLPVQTDSRSQSPVVELSEPKMPLTVQTSTPAASTAKPNKPLVGLVDYPSFNNTNEGYSDATTESEISEDENNVSKPKMNGNNRANLENYDNVKWPSNRYSQVVMDRIACNVVKYGLKFEQILRTRSDMRFRFVQRSHEMFSYYQLKLKLYRDVFGSAVDKSFMQKSQAEMREIVDRVVMNIKNTIPNNTSKQLQAISFSIKQRKNEPESKNSLPPSSFPLESSSSEGENEDMSLEDKEKRRLEREERRKWRKMKREQYEKERARIKEENERLDKKKAEEEDEDSGSSANEMYDVFKFAQENSNPLMDENSKSPNSTNTKTLKRKQAAHAFLSKLTKNDDTPQMIGPQLPPEIASQMMDLEESPPISPATSLPFSPATPPPPPPPPTEVQPNPPPAEEESSKDIDSASKERNDAMSGFSLPVSLKPPEKLPKSSLLAAAISSALTNASDTTVGDSGVENYRPERSRKRKRKSHDRVSVSVSPERRSSSSSKKRKRRHSPHHKKHHKSSSRKKSSHKHKSKKGKKKKSKRYRRSSSRSSSSRSRSRSLSSDSRSNSLSSRGSSPEKFKRRKQEKVTAKSDSEDEVQVISDTCSSRASSVVSVKSTGVSSGTKSNKETIKDITKPSSLNSSRGSSVSRDVDSCKGVSGTSSPLPSKSLLTKASQGFDLKSSSAMAKITEGLRAKVHAMMEAKK